MRLHTGYEAVGVNLLDGSLDSLGLSLTPGSEYTIPPHSVRTFYSPNMGASVLFRHSVESPPAIAREPHGLLAFYSDYVHQLMSSRFNGPFRLLLSCPPNCGLGVSYAQLLCNVVVRNGCGAILVDLDPTGQSLLNVPGVVSAVLLEEVTSLEEGLTPYVPLVYGAGESPTGPRYTLAATTLAHTISALVTTERGPKALPLGGTVILCCSTDPSVLTGVAMTYECTAVHVMVPSQGSALADAVRHNYGQNPISVIELPFVGRLNFPHVPRRLREYFYGARTPLLPCKLSVRSVDLTLYEASGEDNAVHRREFSEALVRRAVAVCHAQREVEVPYCNFAGYMIVLSVVPDPIDEGVSEVSLAAPGPGPLPSRFLILLPAAMEPQELIP